MALKHDGGSDERRQHPRWPMVADVLVTAEGRWLGSHRCENLSAGGMLLVGPPGLGAGQELEVTLRMPEMEPIELRARVRRTVARTRTARSYGVQFSDINADTEDLLQNLVLAGLERIARGDGEITAS